MNDENNTQADPSAEQDAAHLAHHFDTPGQQLAAGRLGMWLFLLTEVLFFGGLFCAYAVYRANHPEIFFYAERFLDKNLGAINTCVLIASSLTMAWGVRCAQLGQRTGLIACLAVTLLCAFAFLGIKYVEYEHKWHEGLLWAGQFDPSPHAAEQSEGHEPDAPQSAESAEQGRKNAGIFFSIYFRMPGLHAVHVIAGIIAIGWILVRAAGGAFGPQYFAPVDLVGLYWHLVDMIWIFLFPLLYLIH